MENTYYDGLSLSTLKDMYLQVRDENILLYVYSNYGIEGIYNLDISYAVGIISTLLESDRGVQSLLLTINQAKKNELHIILGLIQLTIENVVNSSFVINKHDDRFDNLLTIIRHINFQHTNNKCRDLIRTFVVDLLTKLRDFHKQQFDDVVSAVIENSSISEYDVTNWLAFKHIEVLENYIVEYPNIFSVTRSNMSDPYLLSVSTLDINSIVNLIYIRNRIEAEKQDITIEEYKFDDKLYNVIHDLIMNIVYSSGSYICDIFENTPSSYIINMDLNKKAIATFIWSVWLHTNKDAVSTQAIEDFKEDLAEADDYFSYANTFRSYLTRRESEGLIYALYYDDYFDMQPFTDEYEFKSLVSVYKNSMDNLIATEILHPLFRDNPSRYLEEICPVLYENISVFRNNTTISTNQDISVLENLY